MGLRINKILGYGLSNVKSKNMELVDKRLTRDFIENINEGFDDFPKWLSDNKKEATVMLTSLLGMDAASANFHTQILTNGVYKDLDSDIVNYDPEFGLRNVMVLTSPEDKSWSRRDDIIDYIENSEKFEPNWIDLFKEKKRCGIYPYDMMTLIPGRKNLLPSPNKGMLSPQEYKMLTGKYKGKPICKDKVLLKHLKEDWVPKIPESILLFSLYAKMFVNPTDVYQLRPMIYTYWS